MTDRLDQQVTQALRGGYARLFLAELIEGAGHLAFYLLLLELISEWPHAFGQPDVYVLLVVSVLQSGWIARQRERGQRPPGWSRLLGPLAYTLTESLIEGSVVLGQLQHQLFWALSLLQALGASWAEGDEHGPRTRLGVVLARSVQALSPFLFYLVLDAKDGVAQGVFIALDDRTHVFLLVLFLLQAVGLVSLSLLARRQLRLIGDLLERLKNLSRWGFGASVVEQVLRDARAADAVRVRRGVLFVDIRGFTAWGEKQAPEAVIDLLNTFYEAVLESCGETTIKLKMSADETMLVLPDDARALAQAQRALQAADAAVRRCGLSAGAGLWVGSVVEGFFGARASPVHDVIGDTVNTAKRLCDRAPGGQLLAGPVHEYQDAATQVLPRQRLTVKGKAQPLEAVCWQVPPVSVAGDAR